ncbi:isoprenylcysteine carboxyl methyltransferase family protein [Bacillus sp. FJAT-45350]|uniref:isoprenylcysteine carboxyl methyltransferase family protein n=1 Tax=Bacillus sp. FJAT-45350 TaxID=2011014 RepID=UPI0015CB8F49|nr:isoprenylcysteine carboxyl methyltransferase family protein [Bacillus sp. FJAT-45350]
MILFYVIVGIVILQRLVELMIANRNADWIKAKGGYEVGEKHYKYIVFVHIGFFLSLLYEVVNFEKTILSWWWIPFLFFILAQIGRVWSLSSLGPFWNTRIMVLPGANVVAKGPYRFMRHPNYVIVATEIITLPIIFQAYWTAIIFTLLNLVVMSIRIPEEEKALMNVTDYNNTFMGRYRFFPKFK